MRVTIRWEKGVCIASLKHDPTQEGRGRDEREAIGNLALLLGWFVIETPISKS